MVTDKTTTIKIKLIKVLFQSKEGLPVKIDLIDLLWIYFKASRKVIKTSTKGNMSQNRTLFSPRTTIKSLIDDPVPSKLV